jgi:hypothetical protein
MASQRAADVTTAMIGIAPADNLGTATVYAF